MCGKQRIGRKIVVYAGCFPQKKGDMRMPRQLKELNLLDDFLFNKLVSHPEYGEEFSRELLRNLFGREFGKLQVVAQKVYYGSDTDTHGARLDVYLEEEDGKENATIFDVEPEKEEIGFAGLPRRVRFYHSKIDAGTFKSGEDYENLKNVIVIMILPKDPFGYNHMVYTVQNQCLEIPDMPYDDGAKTIFFYTKGTEGNPATELKEFLTYMEETKQDNAKNESLKKIHGMVEQVKGDGKASVEYMKIFEKEKMLREQGEQRLANLISALTRDGHGELITAITENKELREEYYKKYNIE